MYGGSNSIAGFGLVRGISIDGWVLINEMLFVDFVLCINVKETLPFLINLVFVIVIQWKMDTNANLSLPKESV